MSERPKSGRRSNRAPNRAQRKAQQVRLAETNAPAPIDMKVALEQDSISEVEESIPVRTNRRPGRRPISQPVSYVLPREVEYAYISADLRRLILTAIALLALMFVLLFILD